VSFIHLHTHSAYSLLEGLPSPAELARVAAQAGMPALALTDHATLTGAVEFYAACQSAGVRPILGLDLEVGAPADSLSSGLSRLILLAEDMNGWRSLCRLSSATNASLPAERERAGVAFERVAQDSAGLLCIAPASGPAGGRTLAGLRELFSDRLYMALSQSSPDEAQLAETAKWARRLGVTAVAMHAVYYLQPEERHLQRVVTALRLNRRLKDLPTTSVAPPDAYFTSVQEMERRFASYPAALGATQEIAERCQLELPLGRPHYPVMALPEGVTAEAALRDKAEAGARRLYGSITPEIRKRLDHELGVIGGRGYAPLFLIMEEILSHARQTGVPISSRGSAASSLVAHCLNITSPDPLRLNLYFERFLNPARSTPPDIDTDLCSRRRPNVIQHVYDHYGHDRVAMVATVNCFRERSALRETAKAHGLSPKEVTALTAALPQRWWGPRAPGQPAPYAALLAQYPGPLYQTIFRDAAALLGRPRHLSVHPGGVVIAPGPMTDLVPTLLAAKGMLITQFDLKSVERLGLVKMDLLGIRGLTVLGDVADAVQAASPAQYPDASSVWETIPEDDLATRAIVQAARTIGCFQIESPGMRATLKEIGAQSVDDLTAALALYRPGPLTGGLKDAFVRRYLGQEPTQHLHPALEPLLHDTYGVILYQEQVLRIAHDLAGLSLAEADLLRRAMSHFDPGKQMQTLKEKFVAGAQARSGVPPEVSERVWALMAAFAGYGFPKAHAASYAQVAWRAAWCKAHYPAEFMAAVLANWGGYYSQRVYLTEARRMGLKLQPPHINYAGREFGVVYAPTGPVLYMGLNQVKELTRRTETRVLRERPFDSLTDFLARADPRRQEADSLIRVGALDGLGSIPALLAQLKTSARRPGQMALFEVPDESGDDWTLAEKLAAQEALLGASVTAHPLELAADRIGRAGALTTVNAAGRVGQRVRVAGMRQTWRRTRTAQGGYIYVMALEDLEGMLDVVIPGDTYQRYRSAFSQPGPYVLEGTVELDPHRGEPVIRAEHIWPLAPQES
jgi:DNA polymerase III subunit alpha